MCADEKHPNATHTGELQIGELLIPCAVLETGERVVSERGVIKALGGKRGGAHWQRIKASEDGAYLPVYASAKNLEPFIDADLAMALTQPILYQGKSGGRAAYGVNAILLPRICNVWLKARDAGVLKPSQEHMAIMADILIRGLAEVGIIALVDEATGYQAERDRDELQKLLAKYLSEERLKWAKMFPDEYYRQLFRLRGWTYKPLDTKRPKYVGLLTNRLVYDKLLPDAHAELRRLNPVRNKETYRRGAAHFQYLSADIGQPDLRDHLLQLIAIMRISDNWEEFICNFNKAFPALGEPIQVELEDIKDDENDKQ